MQIAPGSSRLTATTWGIPAAENFAALNPSSPSVAVDTSVQSMITSTRFAPSLAVAARSLLARKHALSQHIGKWGVLTEAAFTLKHRLQRQKIRSAVASAPSDSAPTTSGADSEGEDQDNEVEETVEWFDLNEDGSIHRHEGKKLWSVGVVDEDIPDPCDSKSEHGNTKIKALFHRRRTHNEQTLVQPCGVIFARATFYGAEAVSNVLVCLFMLSHHHSDKPLVIRQERVLCARSTQAGPLHLRHQL
jgi:hypothetical protein